MQRSQILFYSLSTGCIIGILGGLIGLGGAEFRLPVLLTMFRYGTLQAIAINLLVSLVTVIFSFIFRSGVVSVDHVVAHTSVIVNILAGSLIGSYFGAHFASAIHEKSLKLVAVVLLTVLSLVLMGDELVPHSRGLKLPAFLKVSLGFLSGIVIGGISSLLGGYFAQFGQ